MNTIRKKLPRILGLCACLLLAACGELDESDAIIRFGISNSARNLDPRQATDATSDRINRLIYRGLVDFDSSGQPIPGLATWERLSERRYRFILRTDADSPAEAGDGDGDGDGDGAESGDRKGNETQVGAAHGRWFSDGRWLTTADVVATYESLFDPATGSPHAGQLDLVERIDVLDDDRLEFILSRADPLFPSYLSLGILPAEALAAGRDFTREPLGSGPLALESWPESGRLVLKRRRDGQRIELVTVRDPSVRVMKLLRGEIQLLQNDLAPELVGFLREQPNVVVDTRPGVNFSYLGFNLEDPWLAHHELRLAIAHAIDREAILKYLFHGLGRPAQTLLPPEHWAGAPGLEPYAHDPDRARALLAGLGFGPERPLRLSYKTSSDPFRLRVASVLQAQLKPVGIELRIRSYDWGTFFGDIRAGRFELFSLTWVGVRGPDIFRYVFHTESIPPQGANRGRFRDPVVDALIDRAGQTAELEHQVRLYRELQARLLRELPYVPLWYEDLILVLHEDVTGYRLAPDGDYQGLNQVTWNR